MGSVPGRAAAGTTCPAESQPTGRAGLAAGTRTVGGRAEGWRKHGRPDPASLVTYHVAARMTRIGGIMMTHWQLDSSWPGWRPLVAPTAQPGRRLVRGWISPKFTFSSLCCLHLNLLSLSLGCDPRASGGTAAGPSHAVQVTVCGGRGQF